MDTRRRKVGCYGKALFDIDTTECKLVSSPFREASFGAIFRPFFQQRADKATREEGLQASVATFLFQLRFAGKCRNCRMSQLSLTTIFSC